MTKDEYLNKLREYLEKESVENIDEIIEKYRARFDLAFNAKMTEEEASEAIGDPYVNVLKELSANQKKEEHNKEESSPKSSLIIKQSYADKVEITLGDVDHIIVNITDDLKEYLNVSMDGSSLLIEDLNKKKSFWKKTIGIIEVLLPKETFLKELVLDLVASDALIEEIKVINFDFNIVSGDASIDEIRGENVSIKTVSGDASIKRIDAKNVTLESVSGDILVNNLNTTELSLDNISGDITLSSVIAKNAQLNTISGDINVTGKLYNKTVSHITGDITYNEIN